MVCSLSSAVAELKAGKESRMRRGSYKVRIPFYPHNREQRLECLSLLLLGFGFCEFGEPDSTLRALRLLHDFKLGEKTLVVSS